MPGQIPDAITALLRTQKGVITRSQLVGLGMPRRTLDWLLASQTWRRLDFGLYFAGSSEPPWISFAWAASLAAGPPSLIIGLSAARLHRLTTDESMPVTLSVPVDLLVRDRPFSTVTRTPVHRSQVGRHGLPCSSVPETIIDCARVLLPRELEALITRAFQERKVTTGSLRRALARRRAVPQRALLEAAAADAGLGAHSALELDYLRDVERAHRLPVGTRQAGRGGEMVDVHYAKYGLVVELDGKQFHADAAFRDRQRDNRSTRRGLATLRYGALELATDPCGIAREVAAVLAERGWEGTLSRCAHCPDGPT